MARVNYLSPGFLNRDVTTVVIVGGGVAGCSLASLLNRGGFDVTLVERREIGGLLREIEFETGYHCDSAPHLLFFDETEERAVGELFRRFTTLHEHEFYAGTYPRGDLTDPHHYPVSEANLDRWDDADQLRAELDGAPGKTDAAFFESYVKNQVGPTLYDRYYRNYTEKHWGIDPARITGDWFDFKLSFPETEQEFFGGGAYYPDDRYTDILAQMVDGCDVVFDAASELVTSGGEIDCLRTESGLELTGDVYVNTIDPSVLVSTVDESLRYRSMVILGVHIEATERLFPAHVDWGYFPNHYEFTRLTDYGFTPQSIPDGEFILTAEFPCFLGDDCWSHPDEWYERYLLEFLDEQHIEAELLAAEVRRVPRAYPLPVEEEIATFERINASLSTYDTMFNLGRISTYEYIWIKDIVGQADETFHAIESSVGKDAG